jgi:MFS family permease
MKDRRFNASKLLLATFVSNFGDGLHTLAIGQVLYERTGSVGSFGAVITLNYLFGILCQFYAGPWADRFPRKLILNGCDIVRGICVLALALGIHRAQAVWWLIALSVVIKIGTHLYRPAFFAMVPEALTSEQVPNFNSKNVACIQGGQLLGMGFFGLLFAAGPAAVFVVDACTFFASALLMSTIVTVRAPARGKSSSLLSDWKEAVLFVRKDRGLLLHITLSASLFLIYQIAALAVVPLVDARFGGDKYWLPILQGAFSLGCIFSVPVMKLWNDQKKVPRWMVAQVLSLGGLLVSGRSGVVAAALFLAMGISSTIAATQLLSRLMDRCRGEVQGRISGLRFFLISAQISILTPFLTLVFERSLDLGILASTLVVAMFTVLALVGSSERFLGDAWLGQSAGRGSEAQCG